ncbi:hypothetical protein D3C87_1865810 [compost metagenome]
MLGIVADRQQAAVHTRVKGLHPAVHHFREARQFRNIADRKASLRQRLVRAAGRNQTHAFFVQGAGKLDDAGLV